VRPAPGPRLRSGELRVAAKQRLLLFFTSADHPQRDAACATLAWLAEAEGKLFECYFDSAHSGIHFGGGHPGWYAPPDLRGPTVVGGRHVEAFDRLLHYFDCEAACLGPTLFEGPIQDAGIPVRSRSGNIDQFYREVFSTAQRKWPDTMLLVGDGGRPQGIQLTPYAFPEVVHRRLLAIADGDLEAATSLSDGMRLEALWLPSDRLEAWKRSGQELHLAAETPSDPTVATQTAWMAKRWTSQTAGFLLGDPELVSRWTPTAARRRWAAVYGIPQVEVIEKLSAELAKTDLAYGRQHHDTDFFKLSRLGVALQVIDPGSPPFPVVSEVKSSWPHPPAGVTEPDDDELRRWASEGRVLSTVLFWTGMIRELQNLYPLADLLALTGLHAGLVLTTESFAFMPGAPLTLVNVAREAGGLFPRVELLLTDSGAGFVVAADSPPERFAGALERAVGRLADRLGDRSLVPRGWWAHMDAPMVPGRPPRVSRFPQAPRLRVRYQPRNLELTPPPPAGEGRGGRGLRGAMRDSPLGKYFAPLRPYEAHRPGPPSRRVLEAVRDAGFEYAITKSGFGPVPRVVGDIDGLTVLNHTAGRWDGWSPFFTINAISDLQEAEAKLLRRRRPGWLLGAIDTCLWTFTGPVWERGCELMEISRWLVAGGDSGRLLNVTPGTVARYARLLSTDGRVENLASA
jgi:hypothetical protein